MALSQESLGFMLAIDKCGRNCQHCPAYGLRQKTETAPFDDLRTRLKIARSALSANGVIENRTIHAWRIGEDRILVVGHGVSGRAMARHYDERPYTEEFDRIARQATNLASGEIMQLYPPPVERIQP